MDRYAKAIAGAILAGLSALAPTIADGNITATDWVLAAIAVVSTFGLVWSVPNAPAKPYAPPTSDSMSTTVNVGDAQPGTPFARPGLHERLMEDHT